MLFDTAIASPRFKNRRLASPLDVSPPALSFRAIWGQFEAAHNGPTIAAGYRLDGARVARDSAFWPARYLDRNKFTLNYLLRCGSGRSFNTSRSPVPSCTKSSPPPRRVQWTDGPFGFVVGTDFNLLILRSSLCHPYYTFSFPIILFHRFSITDRCTNNRLTKY